MSKLRVESFSVSLDGFGAGPEQSLDNPLGSGGVATVRQFLRAALIDELHIAIAPVFLGSGEHLFYGLDLPALGYQCKEHVATENATHIVLRKS